MLKYCKNKYTVTIAVFLVWIFVVDEVSIPKYLKQKMNNKKITEKIDLLNRQTMELQQWMQWKDNKDSIEKFARENYWMKRSDEVIYIFD
jgi:cell division protein FtsB